MRKLVHAEAQGAAAFHNGLKRRPVLDPSLWRFLGGAGGKAPVVKAWLRGWDLASLRK